MPPVNPPNLNRKSEQAPDRSVIISTSVGFQILDADEFIDDTQKLSLDLVIGLSDNVVGEAPGKRRAEKMVDRTSVWTRKLLQSLATLGKVSSSTPPYALAPILPLGVAAQSQYLAQLEDELDNKLCGFALYDTACLPDLPERLYSGVRLSLDEPSTPQKVLDEVSMGVDLFALPLIGAATDAGLALDFAFPAAQAPRDGLSEQSSKRQPLAIDLWDKDHTTDVGPLRKGCSCFACETHHRAYVHHLLDAKEMLAWVLLQIHNHHIIDAFFSGIRESLARDNFERDVETFAKIYKSEMPEKTGQGPRVRGYQMRSEGPGEKKKNPSAYNTLDDIRQKIADTAFEPDTTAKPTELENQGFGVTVGSKTSIGDKVEK
ncbi:MAG: hypothetical protein Q9165_003260 [Trypethelium subeluteriae]